MRRTEGPDLVPELRAASEIIFDKFKASALTSQPFAAYFEKNAIVELYITGADAAACVKSTSCNLAKAGYKTNDAGR